MGLAQLDSKNKIKLSIILLTIMMLMAIFFINTSKFYPEITPRQQIQLMKLRKDAYDYAVRCSGVKNPKVKFTDIRWTIVRDDRLRIPTTDHGIIYLHGFYNPSDTTIYLAYPVRGMFWVLAHESLHAIGYIGHPSIPFKYPCMLMPEQH